MSKLRLGLEWFLNPDHVPLLVGLEQGWFADVGLDLELVEPSEHVDAIAELQAGNLDIEDKADLATLVFYNFEVIEARQRGYDAQFFALKDWDVPDFCQLILIATPELLQQRRQDLQAFLKVLRRGIDFIHQHPKAAQTIYDQRTGAYAGDQTGQAIYNATISCFTHDFSMSADYYDRLQTWMHNTGQIPQCLSFNEYWTNDLAL